MLTERIFQPPTMIREWKVSRALSLTFNRRKALNALNAPTALDTEPSLDNAVMTLIQNVMSTTASMNPQELRKYALGVQKRPSATTLIKASTVKMTAKAMSAQTNQLRT